MIMLNIFHWFNIQTLNDNAKKHLKYRKNTHKMGYWNQTNLNIQLS